MASIVALKLRVDVFQKYGVKMQKYLNRRSLLLASVAKSSSFFLVKLLNFVETRAGDSKLSFWEKSFNTSVLGSSSFAMTYQKAKGKSRFEKG